MSDLPYRAEYAKSGRASCRGCKTQIGKDVLRLAVMVQSPMFDGKTPHWYHFACFFKKQRPKSSDDIQYLENLRIEDQQQILEKIGNASAVIVPEPKGKGKSKGKKRAADAKKAALQDFKIEYAKSGRAACRGCEQKIMKDEVRISKKDYQSEIGIKYGGEDKWYHLTCFAQLRAELGYFESADKLPGYRALNKEDQADAKKQLPAIKQEDVPEVKKIKTEDVIDGLTVQEHALYEEQNKLMYKNRDNLKTMKKDELTELLERNKQRVPPGTDRILDRLADIMTFGALHTCELCKSGQLVFDKYSYKCRGNLTEWTKCTGEMKVPPRMPFKIPKHLTEKYDFLKQYKYVKRDRVIKSDPMNGVKKDEKMEEDAEPKVKRALPPLYNMEFVILGQLKRNKDEMKKQISKLGGKVTTKITANVMAVISTQAEVDKMNARMSDVQDKKIQVVPEDFIDEAPNHAGKIPELIVKKSLVDWGSDPNTRLPPEPSTSTKSKSRSVYTSSIPSKQMLKLKGGGAVDPESGLEDVAHVYKDGKDKYTVVLGKIDIQAKQNSYYKIQLLKSDKKSKFWVFRAWGRIGTRIGSNKLESFDNLLDAKHAFTTAFEEKSGNPWELRDNFVKVPNGYYPIDVDYGEDEAIDKLDITDAPSNLPKPVQDLIHLIFDVNTMKKVMLEFELDTEKMPLGKISKKQIQQAFKVLAELQQLIDNKEPEIKMIDASNRFYTFIPHSFGIDEPPILKDHEIVKQKLDMLDNLMELEIAYNLMKSSGSSHTVDSYYQQLNTEIGVLSKDSNEFEIIQEYIRNTHAETHRNYELDIVDVFTVKRQNEEKRFKPFKKLHNRKLLWHGSRITNYAGILSQGLRIAPPEAPVTGYMFGKGIYFADMVSKSANYCCTTPSNSTGLLLLCDVALGNMYERNQAEYVEKLPKGKHSTKGIGRTEPNPKDSKVIDGIEVPVGKGVVSDKAQSALLYNEYIVYDVAQVNVRYLVRVDFKYKY